MNINFNIQTRKKPLLSLTEHQNSFQKDFLVIKLGQSNKSTY